MIQDGDLIYSDNQAITADSDSTEKKDHDDANARIGDGTDLALVVVVTESFTFGTTTYVQIQLMDSADDSSYAIVLQTDELTQEIHQGPLRLRWYCYCGKGRCVPGKRNTDSVNTKAGATGPCLNINGG
jgi:hypothetical protein